MTRRLLKLNRQIQKTLMEYFMKQTKTPLPGFVSVKEVFMARDMKSAKVFLSVMSPYDCQKEVEEILSRQRGAVQKAVSNGLRIKFCPYLNFFVNHVPYAISPSGPVRETQV